MPTVNCCPAQATTLPLPDFVEGERERGSEWVQRPQALKMFLWPLCLCCRCRNSTFAIVINLMATSWIYVPVTPCPSMRQPLRMGGGFPPSTRFAALFCGLDYLVCGISIAPSRQLAIPYWFLLYAAYWIFLSGKFFNQNKLRCSLKPSLSQMTASGKCFNSQTGSCSCSCSPFIIPVRAKTIKGEQCLQRARIVAFGFSFCFPLGWRTRITWSALAASPW